MDLSSDATETAETVAVAAALAGVAVAAYGCCLPQLQVSPDAASAAHARRNADAGARPTRCASDFESGREPRAGALVVFNGPSSAGKSTLVKAVQKELARRGGVPLRAAYVYLKVAYDDLDVLLPENTLPDLFVFEEGGTMRLRQPGEGGAGGKQQGELSFNGPNGTAVYWFEDRRAELPGGTSGNPAQAIVNHPIADSCLRGQHRSWTALCAAGNNVLADHWIQEPWWKADLEAALQESALSLSLSLCLSLSLSLSLSRARALSLSLSLSLSFPLSLILRRRCRRARSLAAHRRPCATSMLTATSQSWNGGKARGGTAYSGLPDGPRSTALRCSMEPNPHMRCA